MIEAKLQAYDDAIKAIKNLMIDQPGVSGTENDYTGVYHAELQKAKQMLEKRRYILRAISW